MKVTLQMRAEFRCAGLLLAAVFLSHDAFAEGGLFELKADRRVTSFDGLVSIEVPAAFEQGGLYSLDKTQKNEDGSAFVTNSYFGPNKKWVWSLVYSVGRKGQDCTGEQYARSKPDKVRREPVSQQGIQGFELFDQGKPDDKLPFNRESRSRWLRFDDNCIKLTVSGTGAFTDPVVKQFLDSARIKR